MSGKSYLPVLGDRGCPARHRLILPLRCPRGLAPASPARRALAPPGGGACLLCRLPPQPSPSFLPPSPRPPSRRGRGRFLVFLCKGLRPLHPGVWTGRGTGSASISDTRRGACVLVAGSPCHRYARRSGANKAGTLKIHRAADRRQAAGRSSRAEYSEAPGIVGPLSGSDGSFFVILPDRRSSFCGEKRPPG